jgi:hypothetical protein
MKFLQNVLFFNHFAYIEPNSKINFIINLKLK